ncbi:hypothetical protein SAY87_002684 [Trapa incisa]|uniref:Uncharacterized protein n=1 Tax=Trapa incisa TaxID=236973 RepID=A0AAN7Q0G4_9MYRT|nr:hypothetical protein SAY87_002684 [Trapa incisa]
MKKFDPWPVFFRREWSRNWPFLVGFAITGTIITKFSLGLTDEDAKNSPFVQRHKKQWELPIVLNNRLDFLFRQFCTCAYCLDLVQRFYAANIKTLFSPTDHTFSRIQETEYGISSSPALFTSLRLIIVGLTCQNKWNLFALQLTLESFSISTLGMKEDNKLQPRCSYAHFVNGTCAMLAA